MKRAIQISKIFSFITASAAVIALLFGIFRFIENSNANTIEIKNISNEVIELRTDFAQSVICQDSLNENIAIIKDDIKNQAHKIDNLRNTFTKHLLNDETLTKDEFYEYMEDLKNGNNNASASK